MDKPGERLDSWKAIADYLGRDRTTVMRWERTSGLPVRRVQGGAGRSVFAYKEELDRWLAGGAMPVVATVSALQPETHPRRFPWPVAAAAAGILLATAIVIWWLRDAPEVAAASLAGEEIIAVDAGGRELWRHGLPHIDGNIVPARVLISDIDGDTRREVLAALHFIKRGGGGYGAVMALAGNGKLLWQRSLDDRYTFGGEEYGPGWFPEDILVYRSGPSTRIAVAQHHHTWWPGIIVTYDGNGQTIDRFVNAGWIRHLNLTVDGRYLLAAGISNSFGGAALAVLDAVHPGGTSPVGGDLPACSNCPSGNPVAYFVAPWSEVARRSDTPNAVVNVDRQGGIQWHAIQREERDGKAPEVIIRLSPSLAFVRQDESDYLTELRKAFNGSDWQTSLVREWTAARGWRELEAR